ncbi:Nn.00g114900.m01.CDS01 [Neocucurbitaria sp. VM-36]
MPSFFAKLSGSSKKSNPYLNPHHPGHNPNPKATSTSTTASSAQNPQSRNALRPRQASPRGSSDFLAEARQLAGRDPVTGRRRPDVGGRTASERSFSSERNSLAELRQVEEEERTAYQSRAAASKQTTGSRYELFVQESRKRREAEDRIRAARGGLEYYAPERQLEEFYSGGVSPTPRGVR